MEQMKIMNKWYVRTFPVAALGLLLALSACRPSYEVVRVEGTRAAIDSTWDARPDVEAVTLLVPYKQQVDSVMQQVLGTAALTMEPYRPESLLSNLVADILREAASDVLGKPADMGLVNMGGAAQYPDSWRHNFRGCLRDIAFRECFVCVDGEGDHLAPVV